MFLIDIVCWSLVYSDTYFEVYVCNKSCSSNRKEALFRAFGSPHYSLMSLNNHKLKIFDLVGQTWRHGFHDRNASWLLGHTRIRVNSIVYGGWEIVIYCSWHWPLWTSGPQSELFWSVVSLLPDRRTTINWPTHVTGRDDRMGVCGRLLQLQLQLWRPRLNEWCGWAVNWLSLGTVPPTSGVGWPMIPWSSLAEIVFSIVDLLTTWSVSHVMGVFPKIRRPSWFDRGLSAFDYTLWSTRPLVA